MRRLLLALACVGILHGPARGAEGGLPNPDDPNFQYETGMSFLNGKGARKDPAEAVSWLRKAALRGHADAQVELGLATGQGLGGVDPDPAKALAWFRRAAEQGNARGQFQVGLAYRRGEGVAPNLQQSLAWIRKAAENGLPKAQFELGIAYRRGNGVAQDRAQAAFWLGLAADGGSRTARILFPGARAQLPEEQRAELEKRIEAWKRDHPGAADPSDS